MIRKDDPAFKKAVDDSIAHQVKDGTVAKLYDKWFMQPIPPSNAVRDARGRPEISQVGGGHSGSRQDGFRASL
ncbi:hypothetical protein GmRootV213_55510 (plasmid) [Variovorax sp. V213]